jgi:hypothetical protein
MIKTIIDWIFGKKDSEVKPVEAQAPYKVEAPEAPIVISPVVAPAPVVETAPVTVKAKYKKADLNKMTKKDLLDLVAKHGLEVKSRSTKEELVKALSKV